MINKRDLTINTYSTDVLDYRGPTSSSEMNNILNSLKSNAYKCILRTRKAEKKLNDLRKSYIYLNTYMNNKIKDLNYQSNSLLLNTASGLNTSILSFYDYEQTQSGVYTNLEVNSTYGQLTLAEDYSWSKITRYTDYLGDQKPTPDVKIYYDDVVRSPSDDAYNCLDSLDHTLWIEDATYAEHTVKFQLPKSIKPKINSMTLDFFPQYSCIVKNVEYYSIKGSWESLQNYDTDGRSMKLHFAPYDYGDQVRLKLHPLVSNSPIIGIDNFDLHLTNYKNSGEGTFKFPEAGNYTITSLDNLIVDHYIDNYNIGEQFNTSTPLRTFLIIDGDEYEIPYNVINGVNKLNLDVGTINKKEIYIKFIMNEINLTSPVIRGAVLTFTAS